MSVQEAVEFLRKNWTTISNACTEAAIQDILTICQEEDFFSLEDTNICDNDFVNSTNAQKWGKISTTLQTKQQITMEGIRKIFSGKSSKHILENLKKESVCTPAIIEAWNKPSSSSSKPLEKKIFWNVPKRNQKFVGRQEILDKISKSFQIKGNNKSVMITACKGLGGIGKTTIAIQYARMNQNQKNVFWFGAEKAENLKSQMENLEKTHGVNSNWFECNEDWLMIFDNAENPAAIREFIHFTDNSGQILITSRNIQWVECNTIVEIEVFTKEETRNLCELILKEEYNNDDADNLGCELGHLPLALTIALFYINNTANSISKYLENFNEKKSEMIQFEFQGFQILPSVYSTLMISYEKMMQEKPLAAQFFVLCAYYPDPDKIPFALLNYFVFLKTSHFKMYDQLREILIKYSMVKTEGDFFKIHRLVQQVLKLLFQNDEEGNIFSFCRIMITGKFYIKPFASEEFHEFEEIFEILKRLNIYPQNVIFRLLIYCLRREVGIKNQRSIENFAQKNYENMKNEGQNCDFEKNVAYLGYLLVCKREKNYKAEIGSCVDRIIKFYGDLKVTEDKKAIYWEFFATFSAALNLWSSSIFLNKHITKRLESIVKILQQGFDDRQTMFISHVYVHNILEWYKHWLRLGRNDKFTIKRLGNIRFIEYYKIEIDTIQNLNGLECNGNFMIYEIYENVQKINGKISNPEEAKKYFETALEILKKVGDKEKEKYLNEKIKKVSRKIASCVQRIHLITENDAELTAKIYSEFGFKEESLKYWKIAVANPDAKYQNFIEISLIYHQVGNISESIRFLNEASIRAKEQNLERKFNRILGFLKSRDFISSENWDSSIKIQQILEKNFEDSKEINSPEYQDLIVNLSFCHFAKGEKDISKELLEKHGNELIYRNFEKQLEYEYHEINHFHLIDFPMIELISDDLNYRVTKLMEYSDCLKDMSFIEILHALNIVKDCEIRFPNTPMNKDQLKFKISLMGHFLKTYKRVEWGKKQKLNIQDYFEIQNFVKTVKDIWGEGGSCGYKLLKKLGKKFFRNDEIMAIRLFSEALRNREVKYGNTNIKCIPSLFGLERAFNENVGESLKCSERIEEILKDSNSEEYEEFSNRVQYIIYKRKKNKKDKFGYHNYEMYYESYLLAERLEEEYNLLSDCESDCESENE